MGVEVSTRLKLSIAVIGYPKAMSGSQAFASLVATFLLQK